jgi:hypothetical protein
MFITSLTIDLLNLQVFPFLPFVPLTPFASLIYLYLNHFVQSFLMCVNRSQLQTILLFLCFIWVYS